MNKKNETHRSFHSSENAPKNKVKPPLGNFRKRVPGKWVLAGEHAVLRGSLSVALPHSDLGLILSFTPKRSSKNLPSFQVEPPTIQPLIHNLFDFISKKFPSFSVPEGTLKIQSSIPIAAGLGSSAALCVAITHWLAEVLGIKEEEKISFATQLEDLFHGKSSGMDIAVIASEVPISFGMKEGVQKLEIQKIPRFTFHDTGLRSRTSECVQKVEEFIINQPEIGRQLDNQMSRSAQKSIEGLSLYNSGHTQEGLSLLESAMNEAKDCFYKWGLVPEEIQIKENELLKNGARAVKLTGAGSGGVLVALWDDEKK